MFPTQPQSLTLDQIDETARSFKEDLTRECERRIRRGDSVGALTAIHAKEYLDKFVHTLKQRAGSELERVLWPPRARPIRLPQDLVRGRNKPIPCPRQGKKRKQVT